MGGQGLILGLEEREEPAATSCLVWGGGSHGTTRPSRLIVELPFQVMRYAMTVIAEPVRGFRIVFSSKNGVTKNLRIQETILMTQENASLER